VDVPLERGRQGDVFYPSVPTAIRYHQSLSVRCNQNELCFFLTVFFWFGKTCNGVPLRLLSAQAYST